MQSMETLPEANPLAQSSSSVEVQATITLTSMNGNYIEHI